MSHAPQNTVIHDIVPVIVANNCENTSLGIIEMVEKQRGHCLADNCKGDGLSLFS